MAEFDRIKNIPMFPLTKHKTLWDLAFTPSSINPKIGCNYERLEFLRDSFIIVLVDAILIEKHPSIYSHRLASQMVTNENLRMWCIISGLDENAKAPIGYKGYADVFEAYCGCWALIIFGDDYLDDARNFTMITNRCWKSFISWVEDFIEISLTKRVRPKESETHNIVPEKKCLGKSFTIFLITLSLYENNPSRSEGFLTEQRQILNRKYYYEIFHHQATAILNNYYPCNGIDSMIGKFVNDQFAYSNDLFYLFKFLLADSLKIKEYTDCIEEFSENLLATVCHKRNRSDVSDSEDNVDDNDDSDINDKQSYKTSKLAKVDSFLLNILAYRCTIMAVI